VTDEKKAGTGAPVDVDALMDKVRDTVAQRIRDGVYTREEADEVARMELSVRERRDFGVDLDEHVAWLHANWDPTGPFAITSHRPMAGRFIVGAKKVLWKVMRPFAYLVLMKQSSFNARLTQLLTASLPSLRDNQQGMEERFEDFLLKNYELARQNRELHRRIDALAAEVARVGSRRSVGPMVVAPAASGAGAGAEAVVASPAASIAPTGPTSAIPYAPTASAGVAASPAVPTTPTAPSSAAPPAPTDAKAPVIAGPTSASVPAAAASAKTAPSSAPLGPTAQAAAPSAFDYTAFEDRHRGSSEELSARQRDYLRYFAGRDNVLDAGCGRGEFLGLLTEAGIKARGVDLDEGMAAVCRGKGLDVTVADLNAYLAGLPDGSLGGLFAAQVVEHMTTPQLLEMVRLASRKLSPGSPLVVETLNPSCLTIFAGPFYLDLTHTRPVHPEAMRFLMEAHGFGATEIVPRSPFPSEAKLKEVDLFHRLQKFEDAFINVVNDNFNQLNELLYGYQDYAAVGFRE
jgi:SAM-dependent methyltransferase